MSTYVLIHGSFRGGWYWKYVREILEAAGHRVLAPSLTGMGEHSHLVTTANAQLPLRVDRDTWVADVVNLLEFEDLREVILVGHSLGGVITTEASGSCSERIACLAFVDAPILSPGEAPADLFPRTPSSDSSSSPTPAFDPSKWNPPLPVNEAEITDPTVVAWMRERLTPNPSGPGRGPIPELPAEALALPRRILFCTQTPAGYPPALSRRVLDERGTPYDLIDAGHDAPVSAPALVSGWLMNIPTP
jgi:pimeloyl-ACP methyl ester carboxylesterase